MAIEEHKIEREIAKLDWEITHLKRPFWKTPIGFAALLATFAALLTACVAIVGTYVQELNSTVDKKLAEIERLETKAATLKLVEERAKAEQDLASLKEDQEQLSDDTKRLEEQYAALTKFFQDNPNIQDAKALVAALHKARYPLSFHHSFKQRDKLIAKVVGTLSDDGRLAVTISVTGGAKGDKLNLKGYIICVTDIQSGQPLAAPLN